VRALDAPSRIVQAVRCRLCSLAWLPSRQSRASTRVGFPGPPFWMPCRPILSSCGPPGSRPFWGNKRADLRGVLRSYSCGARSPSTWALGFQNFHHHDQPLLETLARALFLCFHSRLTVTANTHPPLRPSSIVAPRPVRSRCPGSSALTSSRFFPWPRCIFPAVRFILACPGFQPPRRLPISLTAPHTARRGLRQTAVIRARLSGAYIHTFPSCHHSTPRSAA
jgi:hypothetical protein